MTATLTATPSVAEGNAITYTVTLNAPAQSPVSVTLANGETITIGAGQSVGSTTSPTTDNVYAGSSTVVNSISGISGGNFENLTANPASVSTTISDEVPGDATTVSLTASPSVAEGGQITYTATLGNVAQSPVTVSLSNGQSITIAAGQSTGSISVPAPTRLTP